MNFKNEIIHGNCIDVMKEIPNNYVSVCITDPPYNYEFMGKDWDNDEIYRRIERIQNSSTLVKNMPYGSGLAGGVRNERWYERNRENILEYGKWIESWGIEILRILKPGGLVFVFNSTRTVAHVQTALENVGFYARDIIVWRRNSGIPKGLNVVKKLEKMGVENPEEWDGWHSCLRNEWEAICVIQKHLDNNYIQTLNEHNIGLFYTKMMSGFRSNIIEGIKKDEKEDYNNHITVKPKALIKELIQLSIPKNKGHIVIDPFLGSGTTAIAAKEMGVDYIGIEIDKQYVEVAKRRISGL